MAENFERQFRDQTLQRKLERQATASRIFSRTKYIEWLLRSVVLIPIVIVIYFLPQWTTEWKLWGSATFAITFVLSWLQFWVFPEWLFGPLVRYARVWRFRALLTKEGFEDFRNVEIDWPEDKLKF